MITRSDFSSALDGVKNGEEWRRLAFKPGKVIGLCPAEGDRLSYLEIRYEDGRRAPWTPTRCDLLTADWRRGKGEASAATPALRPPDRDTVERAAKAMWQAESMRATSRLRAVPWAEEGDDTKLKWRGLAIAALTA